MASKDDVFDAGMEILKMLYGETPSDSLNGMRYSMYCKMAAVSLSKPQPERLPPTERASFYHILRVHLQVIRWLNLSADELDPTEWGWRLEDIRLAPIMTNFPAAPDDILNVIRCKCKAGCKMQSNCSCRANNLKCVTACKYCQGEECTNTEPTDPSTSSDGETDTASEVNDEDFQEEIYFHDSDIDWEFEEEV